MSQSGKNLPAEVESGKGEVSPVSPVMPLVSPREAKEAWDKFEALKAQLLAKSDYQKIGSKQYIKRSGFRKIAVYFGLSDSILEQEYYEREDGSFYWRIVVKAEAPNGRQSIGVGICDSRERNFAHKEHDVYATAHTRAKSRAISDMVAGGVVSAEEMQTGRPEVTQSQDPQLRASSPKPVDATATTQITRGEVIRNIKGVGVSQGDHNLLEKVEISESNEHWLIEPKPAVIGDKPLMKALDAVVLSMHKKARWASDAGYYAIPQSKGF